MNFLKKRCQKKKEALIGRDPEYDEIFKKRDAESEDAALVKIKELINKPILTEEEKDMLNEELVDLENQIKKMEEAESIVSK